MGSLLKRAFNDWKEDESPRMAAGMAYYTIFSLPPLLLLVLMIAGVFVDPEQVSGRIQSEMSGFLGEEGASQIQTMLRNVQQPGTGGPLVAILSVLGLVVGATGAFGQLQTGLNRAWDVEPDPDQGGLRTMLSKRIASLGMVLTIAFLLLVSLVLSAVVSSFGDSLSGWLPGGMSGIVLQVLELATSLAVITLLFAMLYRFLPDARIAWSDVWVGALGTALLFVAGKFLLGLYFSRSDPGQAFGAAGSLALILVWVFYSAMILFFGAEFTRAWAEEKGHGIRPDEGAVRVVVEKRYLRPGEDAERADARVARQRKEEVGASSA